MTIKQQGGIFGRNPTFNDVEVNSVDAASVTADSITIPSGGEMKPYLDGIGFSSGDAGFVLLDSINTITPYDGTAVSNNTIDVGAYNYAFKNLHLAGNVIFRTAGSGIDFSVTSGYGTSELFDDYEEGSFTASIGGFITDPSTPVTVTGYYTKVGRKVSVSIAFNNVTTTGASGAVLIEGLPFTSTSEAISAIQISGTGTAPAVAHLGSGGTVIDLLNAVSYTNISHVAGAGKYFVLSMTYFA